MILLIFVRCAQQQHWTFFVVVESLIPLSFVERESFCSIVNPGICGPTHTDVTEDAPVCAEAKGEEERDEVSDNEDVGAEEGCKEDDWGRANQGSLLFICINVYKSSSCSDSEVAPILPAGSAVSAISSSGPRPTWPKWVPPIGEEEDNLLYISESSS